MLPRSLVLIALLCAPFVLSEGTGTKLHVSDDSLTYHAKHGEDVRVSVISGSQGRRSMRDAEEETNSVTVDIGSKTLVFDIRKLSKKSGSLTITSPGETAFSIADIEALRQLSQDLEAQDHSKAVNDRAGLAAVVVSYLSAAPVGYTLKSRTIPITVMKSESPGEIVSAEDLVDEQRRAGRDTCEHPLLGSISGANPEPYCPQRSRRHSEQDDGATCICPYGDGSRERVWPAIYDVTHDGQVYQLLWRRYIGEDNDQCSGRCGMTCNPFDKEAFRDCFDHDSCLDHVGGSVLGDNSNCGDEFDNAADDYLVSFGWGCC